jgi:hypothetical protein
MSLAIHPLVEIGEFEKMPLEGCYHSKRISPLLLGLMNMQLVSFLWAGYGVGMKVLM